MWSFGQARILSERSRFSNFPNQRETGMCGRHPKAPHATLLQWGASMDGRGRRIVPSGKSVGVNRSALGKLLCVAALFSVAVVCVPIAPSAGSPQPKILPKTDEKQIDSIFSAVTSAGEPGLAVLVRVNGHAVFERGYGVRDLRTKAKIDGVTNFRLASVTKQFTATTVTLLVRDAKLRYDDNLADVFPDFPAYGKSISIRNLLNHTSGLEDYGDLLMNANPNTPPDKIPQIKDAGVLALMEQQTGTKFTPGTKWEYSNTGYAILALVVEKRSGKRFGDFLRERIFAPLKMNNSIAFENGKNEVSNRAFGHSRSGDAWQETDQSPTSAVLGDGGIYSSLEDLAKWDDALAHHTLLSEQDMQPALMPALMRPGTHDEAPKDSEGNPIFYGFGWFLDPYKGHTRMYHDGETIGFRTTIQRFTKDKVTIIVLSNRLDLDPQALAEKVADIVLPSHS
jgi:CubicO group peptidase (beta-lactamase class C family)